MSEKNPNEDYGKYEEKSVPSEHSSHQDYQKLLEKIDKLDEKLSDMKNEDPDEDYKNFDTPTKPPSYFEELVRIFEFFKCDTLICHPPKVEWLYGITYTLRT